MPTLGIVLGSLLAVVGYAVLQDQVCVLVSPEYFTQGHDSSGLPFRDPALLALYWGVQGGLGGGLFLGVGLALACRLGEGPKFGLREVGPGLAWLIGTVALASLAAGIGTHWYAGSAAEVRLRAAWARDLPAESHLAYVAVGAAHFATYLTTVLGSIALCAWAGLRRAWLERRAHDLLQQGASDGADPHRQPDDQAPAQ